VRKRGRSERERKWEEREKKRGREREMYKQALNNLNNPDLTKTGI